MYRSVDFVIKLNYLFSLFLIGIIGFILTSALAIQFFTDALPCPLCLLQRIAYFGIAFGTVLNLLQGYSIRYEGLNLLSITILLIISTRQTLLDIYPRVGHEYIGPPILGIHMPVWSIIFSLLFFLAYAARFIILGYGDYLKKAQIKTYPTIKKISTMMIIYLIILCFINFFFVFLQCGLGSCHTFGYRF